MDKYLHEIAKIELITAEEEVDLARKIHKGDLEARDSLINANLRFVVSVVIFKVASEFELPYVAFVGLDAGKLIHNAN